VAALRLLLFHSSIILLVGSHSSAVDHRPFPLQYSGYSLLLLLPPLSHLLVLNCRCSELVEMVLWSPNNHQKDLKFLFNCKYKIPDPDLLFKRRLTTSFDMRFSLFIIKSRCYVVVFCFNSSINTQVEIGLNCFFLLKLREWFSQWFWAGFYNVLRSQILLANTKSTVSSFYNNKLARIQYIQTQINQSIMSRCNKAELIMINSSSLFHLFVQFPTIKQIKLNGINPSPTSKR